MRFRFPLETLLDLRRREEDAARMAVARLEGVRAAAEGELRRRRAELEAGRDGIRSALVGRVDIDAIRRDAASTIAIDRAARGTAVALAGLLRRIEEERAKLVEAARRRRAVELLKERRFEEWRRVEARRETELLDEIGARVGTDADMTETER